MQFGKLALVLKTLKTAELKRLHKFVHSPYFGVYPPSVVVFNHLQKLHPRFDENKLTAKAIARWHPQLKTIKQQETAGVRLLRAIEKFLELEEAEKHPALLNAPLLNVLRQLELATEFNRQIKKSEQALAHEPEQNIETFYDKHIATELQLNGFDARLNRSNANSILPVIKTLDEFYALKKLRYLCEALNRKVSLGADVTYHNQHISLLLQILQPYTNPKHPYVYLFVNVYKMLSSESYEDAEIYYGLIKDYIVEHSGKKAKRISRSVHEAMGYAITCVLAWYNNGNTKAGAEYLWWINWRLQHHILLDRGRLMPVTFRNIVAASLSVNKPSETEKLIDHYAALLPREFANSYIAFAKGMLKYTVKQHRKAAQYLAEAQAGNDVVFNCTIRRWQFINLYESNPADTDILFSQLESFDKHLLRNKKELQHVLPQFEPFLKYATELLKADSVETTLIQLRGGDFFTGKPWLEEQLQLKNKKPVRSAHGQKVSSVKT